MPKGNPDDDVFSSDMHKTVMVLSFINSTVKSSAGGAKSSRLEWIWAFESHLMESTDEAPWDDTGKCEECNYATMPPILLIGQQRREKTVAMMLA